MSNLYISVIALFLASYVPRFIPLVFCRKKIKSQFIKSFLFYMPYAVLSALTFPAILYSTGNIYTAIIGTACALVMSYFNLNISIVAFISVGIVFGFSFII